MAQLLNVNKFTVMNGFQYACRSWSKCEGNSPAVLELHTSTEKVNLIQIKRSRGLLQGPFSTAYFLPTKIFLFSLCC
jgi:hypothetical protein